MLKVCIAGPYPEGVISAFRNQLVADLFEIYTAETQEEFDTVTDVDAIIMRVVRLDRKEDFARFTHLKMVMRWGAGIDSVDINEAKRRGICVCNMPGANSYAVAELAVALMIDLKRHIFQYYTRTKNNIWDRNAFANTTLNKSTVGLYGGGSIGRLVAKRVQAFGANVQYYDINRLPEGVEKGIGFTYVDLETLLTTSDIISVHLPLLASTHHIIGEPELAKMKRGVLIINTARGGIIDDAALERALACGHVGGAGLDCVEKEDSESTRRMLANDRALITPHVGGSSNDLATTMIPMAVENLHLLAKGAPLKYIVN